MQYPFRIPIAALTVVSSLTTSPPVRAQADVNPPAPNVLLLVDSSASMEYVSGSATFPTCDPAGTTASGKSRWVDLIEVLTGSIGDYRCQELDRRDAAFRSDYALGGSDPYDYISDIPYHRPMSGNCTLRPGDAWPTSNAYEFPPGSIEYFTYPTPSSPDPCASTKLNQAEDGLLDSFRDQVRFALMTFDTHEHPGTGVTGSSPSFSPDYTSGMTGAWSYFVGGAHVGAPAGCDVATLPPFEVGARNASAPPWEGRMVAFGDPLLGEAPVVRNEQIQEVLIATRPYGATPIAGLLDDARAFLWSDTSDDPLNPGHPFGPYNDPYTSDGCRKNTIILLSDGEPNLDLRDYCGDGSVPDVPPCPYQVAEEIADNLRHVADESKQTQVFVIAFALSSFELTPGDPVDCADLTDTDLTTSGGRCDLYPDNRALQACCTLNRIAFKGGTDRAFFPSNADELRAAVSRVLSSVLGGATSRTLPVFASNSGSLSGTPGSAAAYRFYSSFVPGQFALWGGVLERQRYECVADQGELVPVARDITPSAGDDFAYNINNFPTSRKFYSVKAADVNGAIFSQRSIRPPAADPPITDGVSPYTWVTGDPYSGDATAFSSAVDPAAMGLSTTGCAPLSLTECRNKYLRWLVGLNNGTPFTRCAVPGAADCSLIGDIFHSTPALVAPPSGGLRDESYARFSATFATRPLTLYTSSNDGFLHAFRASVTQAENNELWAFMPPAVLTSVPSEYPGAHQLLLDGAPVVRDVIATPGSGSFRLERASAAARAGQTTWRTVLIQAFGGARGGYFALDVTQPDPAATGGGPRFLWQLTQTGTGAPLFGQRGGSPIIATLFFDPVSLGITGGAREIAVAILPGGIGGVPNGTIERWTSNPTGVDPDFPTRFTVGAYPNGAGARSLTIVRLDTGEVIRSFRFAQAEIPEGLNSNRVLIAPISSPITGTPTAYPAGTGMIADRVFVGDAEGTLWRIDLSSTNPDQWTMKPFFDAYSGQLATVAGQPIMTEPVVSVDDIGQVTVNFSTGDQESFLTTPTMKNFVWSVSEQLDDATGQYVSKANWYFTYLNGERVAGPMTLFLGDLFYSTFIPDSGSGSGVCVTGQGSVWGMHYLRPKLASDLSLGGEPRLPLVPVPSTIDDYTQSYTMENSAFIGEHATIFGVGVAQVPSCSNETQVADDFIGGAATHTQASGVTPAKFQLVFHTGTSGTSTAGGRANVATVDLPTPSATPRIDSWASIIE